MKKILTSILIILGLTLTSTVSAQLCTICCANNCAYCSDGNYNTSCAEFQCAAGDGSWCSAIEQANNPALCLDDGSGTQPIKQKTQYWQCINCTGTTWYTCASISSKSCEIGSGSCSWAERCSEQCCCGPFTTTDPC